MTVRNGRSRKVVDLVRDARPDLIVATGDFVDGAGTHMEELMPPWHDLTVPLGKYAVIGNHEVYPGLDRSIDLLEAGGFTLLRGQTASVGQHVLLAGVDDPAVGHRGGKTRITEEQTLAGADPDRFVVLLKHQPRVDKHSLDAVDLQLSGHTHGGQIFPFSIVVNLHYPFPYAKLVQVSDRMRLYVSRGAGLWGPPLRVLAPADVTLFIISPAGSSN
jgi:predicted MPP superfamily phosphohydrolase